MENFDIFKILGYGLTGLACILALLTFNLLKNEQSRQDNVRPQMLASIKSYMWTTLAMVVLVGGFSLPIFQKNTALKQENLSLETQKKASDSLVIAQLTKKVTELDKRIKAQPNVTQNSSPDIKAEHTDNIQKVNELKTQINQLNLNGVTPNTVNQVMQNINKLEYKAYRNQ